MSESVSIRGFRDYSINSDGVITKDGAIVPIFINTYGFKYAVLYTKYRECKRLVHRLLKESFDDKSLEGYVVEHINRDKLDNRLDNLQIAKKAKSLGQAFRKPQQSYGDYLESKSGTVDIFRLNDQPHRIDSSDLDDLLGW